MNKIKEAARLLKDSKNILVLTGAGISTESGVKDFRSSDGLSQSTYKGYYPETILSREFFFNHTDIFYDYLRECLSVEGILPNKGHEILVKLESEKDITVLTQNIDSLHQKAGSENVIELHGNMIDTRCTKCSKEKTISEVFSTGEDCKCGGVYKTDVVLYGEAVPYMDEAFSLAKESDILLVLGTSLTVYPVASIPEIFIYDEKPIVVINKEKTNLSYYENVVEINSGVGDSLEKIYNEMHNE